MGSILGQNHFWNSEVYVLLDRTCLIFCTSFTVGWALLLLPSNFLVSRIGKYSRQGYKLASLSRESWRMGSNAGRAHCKGLQIRQIWTMYFLRRQGQWFCSVGGYRRLDVLFKYPCKWGYRTGYMQHLGALVRFTSWVGLAVVLSIEWGYELASLPGWVHRPGPKIGKATV